MSLYEETLFNDSNLVAYYRFESGALTTDSSTKGHTLTAISAPAEGTGRFGGAAVFDGTDDAYSCADHADFKPTGNFSIGCWVKTTDTDGALFHSYSQNTNRAGIRLIIVSGGKVQLLSGKNTGTTIGVDAQLIVSATSITDNAWHFIVATWDGSYLRIYIDGVSDATPVSWAYAPAYAATNYVRIGCSNAAGSNSTFLAGSLDDIFLFNGKALSASEVDSLYYHLKNMSLDLAAHHRKFDNLKMILQAHDGLEFRNFGMLLEVIQATLTLKNFMMILQTLMLKKESFKMLLEATRDNFNNFMMILEASNGTVSSSFKMLLEAASGLVINNFSMHLEAVSAIPAFRAITAHRLSSVLHEVV
jgi:hypothetical protein